MTTDVRSKITLAKVNYTTGDLDTEAEVIAAINATNVKINEIIERLVALRFIIG